MARDLTPPSPAAAYADIDPVARSRLLKNDNPDIIKFGVRPTEPAARPLSPGPESLPSPIGKGRVSFGVRPQVRRRQWWGVYA